MQSQSNPTKTRRKFDKDLKSEVLRMVAEGQPPLLPAPSTSAKNSSIVGTANKRTKRANKKLPKLMKSTNRTGGPGKAQLKRVEMEPHRRTGDILTKALIIFGQPT